MKKPAVSAMQRTQAKSLSCQPIASLLFWGTDVQYELIKAYTSPLLIN